MSYPKVALSLCVLALLALYSPVLAQDLRQEKMEQLGFLIGEWVGTTTIYEDGLIAKQGAAYEKISYDLNKSILVIELNTEFLQLHTIVLYDEKDQRYYYHRFSKDGAARYPAEFREGQLIVWKDEKTRFFFGPTSEGGFREYGEQMMNGKWKKTFEDTFINTQ